MADLQGLFFPERIAHIGASDDPKKRSGKLIRNLMRWFQGDVYPVNPHRRMVAGRQCYDSIQDLPGPVDLAIITLPASKTVNILGEFRDGDVGYAIIFSAGFAEIGDDGKRLQDELCDIARQEDIRIVGPNCFGIMNFHNGMIASVAEPDTDSGLTTGSSSIVSQSGGLITTLLEMSETRTINHKYLITGGNEADLGTNHYISYLVGDDDINVIGGYIEAFKDGRSFLETAYRAQGENTPIVALKVGRTDTGSKTAVSHTASMTGRYSVTRGAFKQAGVIATDSIYEMIDCCQMLQSGVDKWDGVHQLGAISPSGGGAVMLGDAIAATELQFPTLAEETRRRIRELGGERIHASNPLDTAAAIDPPDFDTLTRIMGNDPHVDTLVWFVNRSGEAGLESAKQIKRGLDQTETRAVIIWPKPRETTRAGKKYLEDRGIPVIPSIQRAFSALDRIREYNERVVESSGLSRRTGTRGRSAQEPKEDLNANETITEFRAKELLSNYGISTPSEQLVADEKELSAGADVGERLVLKVISPDIPHRFKNGLVELDVAPERVFDVYADLTSKVNDEYPDAEIEGILIQEYVPSPNPRELIIGAVKDREFGMAVMIAPGGVLAEESEISSYRIPPLSEYDARDMLNELDLEKIPHSEDHQGRNQLEKAIVGVGEFVLDHPHIRELDCNPVLVTETDAIVLDALINT